MNKPLVSVLMTAYNREDYIAAAIESVLASIYPQLELIIVDDCSKDSTVAIAKSYEAKDARVKVYVNEKNLGDYPNRNKAASYAQGKYIKYLDSDDIMYPHCLEVMVSSMEQFPEAGFGLCAKADAQQPYPVMISPRNAYLEHFEGYGHFFRAPGSAIIKKQVFDAEGGFSGERMIGDFEMWFRLGRKHPLVKMVGGLYWDRLHPGQERQSAYAKQHYGPLTKKVINDAFTHSMCPLSGQDITQIERKLKRNQLKSKFKKLF